MTGGPLRRLQELATGEVRMLDRSGSDEGGEFGGRPVSAIEMETSDAGASLRGPTRSEQLR
jgi:hypothetical protein